MKYKTYTDPKMEEFNLSDAIVGFDEVMSKDEVIHIKNVKEFIRLLKERLFTDPEPCCHGIRRIEAFEKINKLVGRQLVDGT